MHGYILSLFLLTSLLVSPSAYAWHDATHMAIVKAAGLDNYAYLAVGADMAKQKSGGYEDGNHYRNNGKGCVVTAEMVLDQVRDYNCRCGGEGHLYGAIIGALNQYREYRGNRKYAWYPFGFAAHYIGDLSMPLHNVEHNEFNQTFHSANDGVVETDEKESTDAKVARIAREIQMRMKRIPSVRLPLAKQDPKKFNTALAKKIAAIANKSVALGYSMQEANPQRKVMTEEEAYRRLAESAALLKGVFAAMQ